MSHRGIRRFIYCSTVDVMGGENPPADETYKLGPIGPYHVKKARAEELVREYTGQGVVEGTIVRLGMTDRRYRSHDLQVDAIVVKEYHIRTICEYPANNLMGKNSDVFMLCEVTKLHGTANEESKFDLVWNFCEFQQAEDPRILIADTLQLSNGHVLIVTRNIPNPGFLIHRLYHVFKMMRWDHGKLSRMSYKALKSVLDKDGF